MNPEIEKWIEKQERVTIYHSDDGKWYVEWFKYHGGFDYRSGEDLDSVLLEASLV